MTAAELCCAFLDHKLIPVKEEEFWSCWEVSDKEEMGENIRNFTAGLILLQKKNCISFLHTHILECAFMRQINVT